MNPLSQSQLKHLSKLSQKKYRSIEKKVIIEGERLIRQIVDYGYPLESLFISPDRINDDSLSYYSSLKIPIYEIDNFALSRITDTQTPQGVAALLSIPEHELILRDDFFILYLDEISDAGNLGTIIRTASAAGLDAVLVSPGSCEIFNPKVVRSSMGAVFKFPVLEKDTQFLKDSGAQIICALLKDSSNIFSLQKISKATILVIGSEAHGIREEIISMADQKVKIPMSGEMESLNASVAASIAMFYLKQLSNR